MERIEEFYSELYDSDEAVTIQTYPEEVPLIMAWEVEAALRKMKNGKEAGKDQFNIETLKARDATIAKQIAKLYTKCITGRRIPKTDDDPCMSPALEYDYWFCFCCAFELGPPRI